jgi:uncharacterized repeat protein (TIGR04052 family)
MTMRMILISARRPLRSLVVIAVAWLSVACTPATREININFVAHLGERPADCAATPTAISDLRFFVSNPVLVRHDGKRVPIELGRNGRWQQPQLGLLDFENGEGACANGTPDTNTALSGQIPAGQYRGLEFTVGVPFELNHSDPLLAAAPLDDSTMHWHWRSGYKFFRAGVATGERGFWTHIGSSACRGTIQAISGCDNPNRISVALPGFTPGDTVVIDLQEFVALQGQADQSIRSCSSGPAEEVCADAFALLGLDFGDHIGRGEQQVFRVAIN